MTHPDPASVRAASHRYRLWTNGKVDYPFVRDYDSDCRTLADAYLAEHDPTPLTVESLMGMGFGITDSPRRAVRGPLSCNLACLDWTIVHPGSTRSRDVYPPPRTAGELRQILMRLEPPHAR